MQQQVDSMPPSAATALHRLLVRPVVSNLWVATPLGVALIFSGVAVTRHMLAVLVQVRCA